MRCQYAPILSPVSNDVMDPREQNEHIRMILLYIYVHTITTITCLPVDFARFFFLLFFFDLFATSPTAAVVKVYVRAEKKKYRIQQPFFFFFSSLPGERNQYTQIDRLDC